MLSYPRHNLALENLEKLEIPVHHQYYEDYTTRYNDSVDELNAFLELPIVNKPATFQTGKTYPIVYDAKEFLTAARLVKFPATPKCFERLRRYFVGPKFEGAFPEINSNERLVIWLASFPGSVRTSEAASSRVRHFLIGSHIFTLFHQGATEVIEQIQYLSNATAATNIGEEVKDLIPVHKSWVNGPFLLHPGRRVPRFVLTKTHCAGYCDDCNRSASVKTYDDFEAGCRTTRYLHKQDRILVVAQYDITLPKKQVQLVRNPMDVVVSRMHQGIMKRQRQGWSRDELSRFNDTRAGLMAWCSHVDSLFDEGGVDASALFSTNGEEQQLYKDVPCYSEFFRLVQWHNHAIALSWRRPIPFHTLYYEEFVAQDGEVIKEYEHTGMELFHFIEMNIKGKDLRQARTTKSSFGAVDTPSASLLFDRDQRCAVGRFIRAVASPVCWERMRRYFKCNISADDDYLSESISV